MAGKAKTRKTFGRKLKDQDDEISNIYGLAGSRNTPTASTMSFAGAGISSTPPTIDVYSRLKTSGDTMIGAIAFYPKIAIPDGNGAIDLMPTDNGATNDDYSSYLIVTGATNPDDLVTLSNPMHTGQLIHIEANTTGAIVLKHNTGNIFIPSGSDHTIPAGGFATLIFDSVIHTNKWTLISSSSGASSGANTSLSNLSNVAVNTDIDMGTYDITNLCRLEFDPAGSTLANTTAGIDATADEMHFNVPVGDDFKFTVNGTEEFVFKSNELDVKENDICNVGTIFTDYIAVSSGNTMIKSVGHFDPFGGDTYDLGDGTNYWRHLYISGDIHFKDGDDAEIKKLSTGLEYEVATDDYHRFQVNNVTKFQVGATSCSMDGGMIIGSADGVEIGYKVDNQALTVGSKGSMIHPYLESTTNHSTGSNSTLDGYFGDRDGAIGIQYDSSESAGSGKYRIWIRSYGGWYKAESY